MWDEITDPFPNFNNATVEVWEWLNKIIPHMGMCLLIHASINLINLLRITDLCDGNSPVNSPHKWPATRNPQRAGHWLVRSAYSSFSMQGISNNPGWRDLLLKWQLWLHNKADIEVYGWPQVHGVLQKRRNSNALTALFRCGYHQAFLDSLTHNRQGFFTVSGQSCDCPSANGVTLKNIGE